MRTFGVLLKNELKLNIRNMNMVIFAMLLPLAVLFVLGMLYGTKPAAGLTAYTFLEQSFGALCVISICAGGFMGLPLVISDYRERNILKRLKVTPVRPVTLLAVEFVIYVLYAAASLLVLIPPAVLIWHVSLHGSGAAFLLSWALTVVSSLSMGMMVGGLAKNAKSASVIACILYFPMLLLSGATLPYEVMPRFLQNVVQFFPLTQGIQLMKSAFLGIPAESPAAAVAVMAAVTVICNAVSVKFFRWE